MALQDPRVDAYIATAAPFAQPLLALMRKAFHAGCPGLQETIKWGMPFFMHQGRILGHMAALSSTAHWAFGTAAKPLTGAKTAKRWGSLGASRAAPICRRQLS